jgi:hypothetical protein
MTDHGRKTLNLSLIMLVLAGAHFFIAYQLTVTSAGGNISPIAWVFIILGIVQIGLGLFGLVAAIRRR